MKELGASLAEIVRQQPEFAALAVVGFVTVLTIFLIVLLVMVLVMGRRQARLLRGADGLSLETALQNQMDSADATRQGIDRALKLADDNSGALQNCLQRIGFLRYDAFADVGGEQSFSVALLDMGGNGLILTGIHSRHDVRIYAKPIIANDSSVSLTAEERKVISSATTSAQAGGMASTGRGGRERR